MPAKKTPEQFIKDVYNIKGEEYEVIGTYINNKTPNHDRLKNQYCIDKNINLLRIPYWDFENIEIILNQIILQKTSNLI